MSAAPLLYLFDDRKARAWQPFALTRPAGELLLGCLTMRARAERVLGMSFGGHLGCDELAGFEEPDGGPVLTALPLTTHPRLFLCSRAVPAWGARLELPSGPAAVEVGGETLGWYAPAGAASPPPQFFSELDVQDAPPTRLSLPGYCLAQVWELVGRNSAQLVEDFGAMGPRATGPEPAFPFSAIGSARGWLRTGDAVTIEPGVVLDFTGGPIWLEAGVQVRAFTRLAGPAYVGAGSVLLGGALSGVSVGPVSRVHGEVEECVILGYSNKAHDGFLGHSYLGRWVNLGAQTVNSDLKNNYGSIRMWTPAGVADTGYVKLGCLLGDHVKTAIGTLLGTGTVVGAGSSLFGRDAPGTFVGPFTWGCGDEATEYDVERFLDAAGAAMSRRDVQLTGSMRRLLARAHERGRAAGGE